MCNGLNYSTLVSDIHVCPYTSDENRNQKFARRRRRRNGTYIQLPEGQASSLKFRPKMCFIKIGFKWWILCSIMKRKRNKTAIDKKRVRELFKNKCKLTWVASSFKLSVHPTNIPYTKRYELFKFIISFHQYIFVCFTSSPRANSSAFPLPGLYTPGHVLLDKLLRHLS